MWIKYRNMKTVLKISACVLFTAFGFSNSQAQALASLSSEVTVPSKPAANTEMTIILKNSAEKPVIIFAGPKEGIRDPKVRTVGGLSKNTLYLQSNDVVCLMDREPKAMACTVIKPGISSVEVNVSATTISSK